MDGPAHHPAAGSVEAAEHVCGDGPGHEIHRPERQTIPLVVASPHSGTRYPRAFVEISALDFDLLRRSEDPQVDMLGAGAVRIGAPLLRAHFPRAYVDVNREPFELDPGMFTGPLPRYVRTRSPRISAGFGTIARIVCNGHEIYRGKLEFGEALRRIESLHAPYHAALANLLAGTRREFGCALLVDLHSMPSTRTGGRWPPGPDGADIVLGDRHGTSCAGRFVDCAEDWFRSRGYSVVRNEPYPGGYSTQRYGKPETGFHALQIELNRAAYMDEETMVRGTGFGTLAECLTGLFTALGDSAVDDG